MFVTGFVLGMFFAYSGIISFLAGGITGVILAKNFLQEIEVGVFNENILIEKGKKYIHRFYTL